MAIEAAKGEKTIAHPNQIRSWRNHLREQLPELFSSRRPQQEKAREEPEAELYQPTISSFTTPSDRTRRWDTGCRMRSIL